MKQRRKNRDMLSLSAILFITFGIVDMDFEQLVSTANYRAYILLALGFVLMVYTLYNRYVGDAKTEKQRKVGDRDF